MQFEFHTVVGILGCYLQSRNTIGSIEKALSRSKDCQQNPKIPIVFQKFHVIPYQNKEIQKFVQNLFMFTEKQQLPPGAGVQMI